MMLFEFTTSYLQILFCDLFPVQIVCTIESQHMPPYVHISPLHFFLLRYNTHSFVSHVRPLLL